MILSKNEIFNTKRRKYEQKRNILRLTFDTHARILSRTGEVCMLLNEDELRARMESPLNLLNRLRTLTNPHKTNIIPALPPTSDDLIKDLDEKIANTTTRTKATNLLNSALTELNTKIKEVQKPEKLAAIANDMSRIIERSQPNKGDGDDNRIPQIIIYAPQIVTEERFNVIDVGDT